MNDSYVEYICRSSCKLHGQLCGHMPVGKLQAVVISGGDSGRREGPNEWLPSLPGCLSCLVRRRQKFCRRVACGALCTMLVSLERRQKLQRWQRLVANVSIQHEYGHGKAAAELHRPRVAL